MLQSSVGCHSAMKINRQGGPFQGPMWKEEAKCEVLVVPLVSVDTWFHTSPIVTSGETSSYCTVCCRVGWWPSGVFVAVNLKSNSSLPRSIPTDGSIVRTIKTNDIGTLTYWKKKENISHGNLRDKEIPVDRVRRELKTWQTTKGTR